MAWGNPNAWSAQVRRSIRFRPTVRARAAANGARATPRRATIARRVLAAAAAMRTRDRTRYATPRRANGARDEGAMRRKFYAVERAPERPRAGADERGRGAETVGDDGGVAHARRASARGDEGGCVTDSEASFSKL